MQSRTRGYIIVATALAFLAACGGQADQGGTPQTPAAFSPESQPSVKDAASEAGTTADSGTVTKALNPAHLNRRGVSAELFAAMLLQGGASSAAPLEPDARRVVHEMAPTAPTVDASQKVGTGGARTHQVESVTGMWGGWNGGYSSSILHFLPFYGGADNEGRFTRISATLPVDVNPVSHTSAASADGGVDLSPLANLAGGTRILSLDAPATVESLAIVVPKVDLFGPQAFGDRQEAHSTTLTPQLPGTVRRGQPIGYQNVVQSWVGENNARAHLVVLPDNGYDRARLCLHTVVPAASRTSCTIWQVPANWRPGTPITYRGHYITDNRALSGQSGQRRWQTLPPAPAIHSPVLASGGNRTAAPAISDTGINGDVLATMLTQATPSVSGWSWSSPGLEGERLTAPSPMGHQGPVHRSMESGQTPRFQAPDNTPAFHRSIWLRHYNRLIMEPWLPFLAHRDIWFTLHLTANLGHFSRDGEGKVSGFSLANLQQTRTGTPILSLAHNASVDIGYPVQSNSDRGNGGNILALGPTTSRQLQKGMAIGFDDVVQRWQTLDGTRLTLNVLRGLQARQAQVCLTLEHADSIGRRSCTVWEVPQNWTIGHPLTYLGAHISDVRKHIDPDGDPANLYWMGTPQ
ncbi:MAG: hypothetical protein Q4D19_12755 [Lautropia sp.]|nr:hypothetical protein [Lautropia sp.]